MGDNREGSNASAGSRKGTGRENDSSTRDKVNIRSAMMYALWELKAENETRYYELYQGFLQSQGAVVAGIEIPGQMSIEDVMELEVSKECHPSNRRRLRDRARRNQFSSLGADPSQDESYGEGWEL